MNSHAPYTELVVGYALDALEPGDEQELLDHLLSCGPCQQLLTEMREVAADLASEVELEEPGPDLFARIQKSIAEAPQKISSDELMTFRNINDAHRASMAATGDVRAHPSPTVGRSPLRRRFVEFTRPALIGLAAALLAVLALAGVGTYAIHVTSQRDDKEVALRAEQSALVHLQNAGAYSVALTSKSSGGGPGSAAAVVDGKDVYLVANNMAKNDTSSSVYVLWAAHPAGPMVAIGTFDVANSGVRVLHMTLPPGIVAPETFGITHEPGRTAPAVPGPIVVMGTAL